MVTDLRAGGYRGWVGGLRARARSHAREGTPSPPRKLAESFAYLEMD